MRKSGQVVAMADGGRSEKTLFNGGVLSAFGQRDYTLVWSGALISNVGTWIQSAALLWMVKVVIKSNSWVGAVNMANFLPVLFLVPFAGSFADRYNRRTVIIVGQTVMMLGALALGISASLNVDSKAVIILTVSIIGIAFALTFPAWQAILPDLVPRSDILSAIALSSAQWNLARFIGPIFAAIILSVSSPAVAFYVNAASFLFVIGALLLVHPHRSAVPSSAQRVWHDVLDGWKYVWQRKWMVNLLTALSLLAFFGVSYIVLIPAVAKDIFHKGSGSYSLLLMMTGLGAVVGAPFVTYLGRHFKEREIVKACALSLGLLEVAFAFSRIFWISCVISVGLGAAFMMTGTISNSVLQSCSDREMRGRVISFYIMVFIGVFALGGQFMGYLADARSAAFALALGGLVCIGTAAVLTAFPVLIRDAVSPKGEEPLEPAL